MKNQKLFIVGFETVAFLGAFAAGLCASESLIGNRLVCIVGSACGVALFLLSRITIALIKNQKI